MHSGSLGSSLSRLGAIAAGGVVAGLAIAAKSAVDFEREMRNVNSIARLGDKEFKGLGKSVTGMAREVGQKPKVLAAGLYDIVSSGFKANDAIKVLRVSAKAATAGMTDTATASKAVTAALNAYHLGASNARQVSDVLFQTVNKGVLTFEELSQQMGDLVPAAAPLGVSLEEVGAGMATLTLQGVPAAEAATRMKNAMLALAKPTPALAKLLKDQGFASGEAAIKAKGFSGVLELLSKTTKGSVSAQAALTPEIRTLLGVVGLTGKNLSTYNDNLRAMADAQKGAGVTAGVFAEQSKSVGVQWQKVSAQLEVLKITIGTKLLPVLSDVFAAFTRNLPAIERDIRTVVRAVDGFAGAVGGWKTLLAEVGLALLALKATFLAVNIFMRVQAFVTATSMKAALISTGIGAIAVAAGIAAGYVITHWNQVRDVFLRIAKALAGSFTAAWEIIKGGAKVAAGTIVTYLTAGVRVALEALSRLPFGMGDKFKAALDGLKSFTTDWVKQGAAQMKKGGELMGSAWGDAFGEKVKAAVNTAVAAAVTAMQQMTGATGVSPAAAGQATVKGKGVSFPLPGSPQSYSTHGTRPGVGTHNQVDWQSRNAVDIFAKPDTPVLSPVNGVVEKVSGARGTRRVGTKVLIGYGVTIRGQGMRYYIAHIENVTVRAGDTVKRGQVIGTVDPEAGHIHFAVESGDPAAIFLGQSATLPGAAATKAGGGGGTTLPKPTTASAPTTATPTKAVLPTGFELPIPIRTAIAAAALTVKDTVDDLRALNQAKRFIEAKLGSLKGEQKISGLEALKAINDQIAGIETAAVAQQRDRQAAAQAKQQARLKAHLERMKTIVAERATVFEQAFSRLAEKAFAGFDRESARGLAAIGARFSGETPEEAALREFRAARTAEQRATARAEANLIEDAGERAARIRELDLQDQEEALVAAAERSRAAREAEQADAEAKYNDLRATQREQLGLWLDEQQGKLESGKTQWSSFWGELVTMAGLAGVDVSTAFWQSFAQAGAAASAAHGQLSDAQLAQAVLPVGATTGGSTTTGYVVGGVLVQPPRLDTGGLVTRTGLAMVHRGETYSGVGAASGWGSGDIVIQVDGETIARVNRKYQARHESVNT